LTKRLLRCIMFIVKKQKFINKQCCARNVAKMVRLFSESRTKYKRLFKIPELADRRFVCPKMNPPLFISKKTFTNERKKSKMKKSKIQCRTRIVTTVLTVAILLMSIIIPSSATTYKTLGNTTIEPSKSSFRDARKTVYSRLIETISDSIGSAYDTHIYHYRAPRSGDYIIYTEGSTDTVGRVFYETTFDWKPICTSIDDVSGTNRSTSNNFFVKLNLTAGEDYYIAIRGYGSRTGSYKLHIEPYRDKCVSSIGAYWLNYNRTAYVDDVYSVEYYTPEQCAFLYDFVTSQAVRKLIKNYWTSMGTEAIVWESIQEGMVAVSWADTVGAFEEIPGASAVISIFGAIVDKICEAIFEDTGEEAELLGQIDKCCGLIETKVKTVVNGRTAYGTVYSCQSGMRIQRDIDAREYRIYALAYGGWMTIRQEFIVLGSSMAYNDTNLFGGDCRYGCWVINDVGFLGDIKIN